VRAYAHGLVFEQCLPAAMCKPASGARLRITAYRRLLDFILPSLPFPCSTPPTSSALLSTPSATTRQKITCTNQSTHPAMSMNHGIPSRCGLKSSLQTTLTKGRATSGMASSKLGSPRTQPVHKFRARTRQRPNSVVVWLRTPVRFAAVRRPSADSAQTFPQASNFKCSERVTRVA
jgi:hypothetical protein